MRIGKIKMVMLRHKGWLAASNEAVRIAMEMSNAHCWIYAFEVRYQISV